MLRIRTGARDGLRWGMFGFVAAVFTIASNPLQAAPYADIVVDDKAAYWLSDESLYKWAK